MTNGSRLAASAVALALAACNPEAARISTAGDAGPGDAAREHARDAARAETRADAAKAVDARAAVDAELPCVVGGTTEAEPVIVGCAQSSPGPLVIAGDHVYWTVQGSGPIVVRAAIAGGEPEPLVTDVAAAVGLAVDASFAYYTQPAVGRVMRVPIGGGPPVVLASGLDFPVFLAIDAPASGDSSLYWTGGQATGAGTVTKLSLASGATPLTLIDGQTRPRAIVARDGFVYWADFTDGTILRTAAAGPGDAGVRTATRLAVGLTGPSGLALAGTFVYVTDQSGHVQRVPLAGGALEDVVDSAGQPFGIATDGLSLYWSVLGDGAIFKVPLPSSAPIAAPLRATLSPADAAVLPDVVRPYVGDQPDPRFVAVSATDVYWETWGGYAAIRRFAK